MNQTSPPTCPQNEQAVGWALHSLEPDEEMAVLLHLPECSSCRQVAGGAEAVLSHLGAAVEQVEPPPSLRDRLMSNVAETPQQRGASEPKTEPAVAPQPTPATPQKEPAHRASRPADNRPARGGTGWSRRTRRLVAAAFAMVAVLAIGGLATRNAQLSEQRDAQIAQAQTLENLLDQFDQPGVQHALLSREDGSTVAAVVVENGRPQILPLRMSTNQVDRDTYVLWGIAGGAPEPLGTFDVTGNDQGLLTVGSAAGSGYVAYAVSLEPGRTAPAAPSAVVAKGAVAT